MFSKSSLNANLSASMVNYAKEVVLKELYLKFGFGDNSSRDEYSQLIQALHYENEYLANTNAKSDLIRFVKSFIQEVSEQKLLALYFWQVSQHSDVYCQMLGGELKLGSKKTLFGFVEKLLKENEKNLNDDLIDSLISQLSHFASEPDFEEYIEASVDNFYITMYNHLHKL